jgi:hypothetical protein
MAWWDSRTLPKPTKEMSVRSFQKRVAQAEDVSVVVESDARTVYAYILEAQSITGSVWLFNLRPPPLEPEWGSGVEGPYLNHADAAIQLPSESLVAADDFTAAFNPSSEHRSCAIYYKGTIIALLWPGSNPGKSVFARIDTPLALQFDLTASQLETVYRKLGVTQDRVP